MKKEITIFPRLCKFRKKYQNPEERLNILDNSKESSLLNKNIIPEPI